MPNPRENIENIFREAAHSGGGLVMATLLVLMVSIVLFLIVHGSGVMVHGPSYMQVDSNNHLYVLVDETIYKVDAGTLGLEEYPTTEFDLDYYADDFGVFANGDLLFSRRGLQRCETNTFACNTIRELKDISHQNFQLFIHPSRDEVFVSYQNRDKVIRLDLNHGEKPADIIAKVDSPTGLFVEDLMLYVVIPEIQFIGIYNLNTDDDVFSSRAQKLVFPDQSAVLPLKTLTRVGQNWWVIGRNDLYNGKIYVFDDKWQFRQELALPSNIEVFTALPYGDKVLLSDSVNMKIHQVTNNGEYLGEWNIPGLNAVLEPLQATQQHYRLIDWLFFTFFIMAGVGTSAFWFFYLKPQGRNMEEAVITGSHVNPENPNILWLFPDRTYFWFMVRKVIILIVMVCVLAVTYIRGAGILSISGMGFVLWAMLLIALGLILLIQTNRQISKPRLGVLKDRFVVREQDHTLSYAAEQCYTFPGALFIGTNKFNLEFLDASNDVGKHVAPVIKKTNPLSELDYDRQNLLVPGTVFFMGIGCAVIVWFMMG